MRSEVDDILHSGLVCEIVEAGTGPSVRPGQLALSHEVTRLRAGTFTADPYALNQPIEFVLGGTQVMDGTDDKPAETDCT